MDNAIIPFTSNQYGDILFPQVRLSNSVSSKVKNFKLKSPKWLL